MKAIGIPHISEDIVSVNTAGITEHIGLTNEKIRCGRGPVDLVIGIDHAHVHTGHTKKVDHLVATKSSLGGVLFGSIPGGTTCDANRVLSVNYATPVDLSDFRTTERRGIEVKPCVHRGQKSTIVFI